MVAVPSVPQVIVTVRVVVSPWNSAIGWENDLVIGAVETSMGSSAPVGAAGDDDCADAFIIITLEGRAKINNAMNDKPSATLLRVKISDLLSGCMFLGRELES